MAVGWAPDRKAGEPPLRVESREELVYLLGEACELEHGLLCQYLYAQFSLKRSVDEGVTPEQLARIQTWENHHRHQQAGDAASCAGHQHPDGARRRTAFRPPNFPILSRWYPPDVQIALLAFGERALRHFMYMERPEGMPLEDAEVFTPLDTMEALSAADAQLTAGPEEWHTVGHLYQGIEAGLAHLVDLHGHADVFIGPPEAQATTQVFEWSDLIAVTDLASARQAIEVIVEQGEGARGDWVNSHFGRFVGILEDYLAVRAADPTFEPARPVLPAYLRRPPDVTEATVIEDPLTRRVADLFNAVYEVVLQLQSRYFVHHGETPEEIETLARTVKHLMNWVMRLLGPVLTSLPVGPARPGRTTGPCFEMVHAPFFVLPHRSAAWKVLRERLDSLATVAEQLSAQPGLGELSGMANNFRGFAGDLGQHLDARAAGT